MAPRRLFAATIANGAAETEAGLAALPVEFHAVPVSRVVPVCPPETIAQLHDGLRRFDWVIFASANAASLFLGPLSGAARGAVPRIACVGPNTAEFVERMGFPVALVSAVHTGAALAEEFIARHGADRPAVLLPRPDKVGSDLAARLDAAGIPVTQVILYRTDPLDPEAAQPMDFRDTDLFVFMSPSGVKHFTRLHTMPENATAVAIGPTTAAALAAAGHHRVAVAARACREGLLETITQILNNSPEREGR